ncbi:MAG: glycosyltransferase family 2 protein [Ruminococcaceae bacterium]|nr:glycosyltransferase family 2 protein [Oscillospiraceae bacterium]
MTVSLCVVAYNEEQFLPNLLKDLENQTYPHDLTEIVLIDGNSKDNTKQIMTDFAKNANSFYSVQVLNNPQRIQAAGWNIAIENAKSDIIIRIDAHTHIPAEFTAKNMALQEKGEYVTGGVRPCLIDNPTPWKKTLLEVENSMFGSSVSKGRKNTESCYVKSMFHAAYRREVFEKAGNFNTKLLRTEDNEMHYRIREAGYKLYCDPDIVSYQYARSNFKKMVKQKYGNGYWIGLTLGICPGCISLFHLVPFVFVLGIVFTSILALFSFWYLAVAMWTLYALFVLTGTVCTILNKQANRWTFLMPALFLIMHISYGVGTLVGLVKMPFYRKRLSKR